MSKEQVVEDLVNRNAFVEPKESMSLYGKLHMTKRWIKRNVAANGVTGKQHHRIGSGAAALLHY